jgi:hypothetical protein
MARQRLAPILLLLLLLLTGCTGAEVPRPAELDQAVMWSDIPDAFSYVSWQVPQLDWGCEPPPESDGWRDIGYPTRWLAWKIGAIMRDLVCILLTLFQFLANVLADVINAILSAFNWFWRLLIFCWLTVRGWFYALWWLLELLRAVWQSVYYWLLWLWEWIQAIWAVLLEVLIVIGNVLLLLLNALLALFGILAWIGGLLLGVILGILGAFEVGSHTTPALLVDTHPIYRYLRGALEGFRDSRVGFILYLAWAMAYVGFVFWMGKFLAEKAKPSG